MASVPLRRARRSWPPRPWATVVPLLLQALVTPPGSSARPQPQRSPAAGDAGDGQPPLWRRRLVSGAPERVPRTHPLMDIGAAPNIGVHGNPVNFSFVLTGLSSLNGNDNTLQVYAFIQMTWRERRWSSAVDYLKNYVCDADDEDLLVGYEDMPNFRDMCVTGVPRRVRLALLGRLLGNSHAFLEAARNQQEDVFIPSPVVPWSPIPPMLMPMSSDNYMSTTNVDPYISHGSVRPGMDLDRDDYELFVATWLDVDTTTFKVALDYTQFPFDEQILQLCVPFDVFVRPEYTWGYTTTEQLVEHLEWGYEPCELSPWVTQRVVKQFKDKGFHVKQASPFRSERGVVWKACLQLTVGREPDILALRFFLPLLMLVTITFAAYWIPVTLVMPRVAVVFVSFLALQVFRGLAYGMVPQKSSQLLWIDVTMFCVTEILFVNVMANAVALVLHNKVSHFVSGRLDLLGRTLFTFTGVLLMLVLFVLGSSGIAPAAILLITQCIMLAMVVLAAAMLGLCLLTLPRHLMKCLIRELTNEALLWKDGIDLDNRELAAVFRLFDKDNSGCITPSEIVAAFKEHGLTLPSENMWAVFEHNIVTACSKASPDQSNNGQVDLDMFRTHLKEFTGGRLVRQMKKHASDPALLRQILQQRQVPIAAPQEAVASVPVEIAGDAHETHVERN